MMKPPVGDLVDRYSVNQWTTRAALVALMLAAASLNADELGVCEATPAPSKAFLFAADTGGLQLDGIDFESVVQGEEKSVHFRLENAGLDPAVIYSVEATAPFAIVGLVHDFVDPGLAVDVEVALDVASLELGTTEGMIAIESEPGVVGIEGVLRLPMTVNVLDPTPPTAVEDFAGVTTPWPTDGTTHPSLAVDLTSNDTVPNAGTLVSIAAEPIGGMVSLDGSRAIYTPRPSFRPAGENDQLIDEFRYRLTDPLGNASEATVTVAVANSAPELISEASVTFHKSDFPDPESGVIDPSPKYLSPLAFVSDPDEEDSVQLATHFLANDGQLAALGWELGTNVWLGADNSCGDGPCLNILPPRHFRPPPGGEEFLEVVLQVRANDRFGKYVDIPISVLVGNRAPQTVEDVAFMRPGVVSFDIDVVANDFDDDSDTLKLRGQLFATAPAGWVVDRLSDRQLRVFPPASFQPAAGEDWVHEAIVYRIKDGYGGFAPGQLHVYAVNNPPRVIDDSIRQSVPLDTVTTAAAAGFDFSIGRWIHDADGDPVKILNNWSVGVGRFTPYPPNSPLDPLRDVEPAPNVNYVADEYFVGWDKVEMYLTDDVNPGVITDPVHFEVEIPVTRLRGSCADCKYLFGDWDGIGVGTDNRSGDTVGAWVKASDINGTYALVFIMQLKNAASDHVRVLRFYPQETLPEGHQALNDMWDHWIPIAGDWDNDGIDTVALYDRNPSSPGYGRYYVLNGSLGGDAGCTIFASGELTEHGHRRLTREDIESCAPVTSSDLVFSWHQDATNRQLLTPIAGDWNGLGYDSIGAFTASANTPQRPALLFETAHPLYDSNGAPAIEIDPTSLQASRIGGDALKQRTVRFSETLTNRGVPWTEAFAPFVANNDHDLADEIGVFGPTPSGDAKVLHYSYSFVSPSVQTVTVDGLPECGPVDHLLAGNFRGDASLIGNGWTDILGQRDQLVLHTSSSSDGAPEDGCLWITPMAAGGERSIAEVGDFLRSAEVAADQPLPELCVGGSRCARWAGEEQPRGAQLVVPPAVGSLPALDFDAINGDNRSSSGLLADQGQVTAGAATYALAHSISAPGQPRRTVGVWGERKQPTRVYVHTRGESAAATMNVWDSYELVFATGDGSLNPPGFPDCTDVCIYDAGARLQADSIVDYPSRAEGTLVESDFLLVNGSDLPRIVSVEGRYPAQLSSVDYSTATSVDPLAYFGELLGSAKGSYTFFLEPNSTGPTITVQGVHDLVDEQGGVIVKDDETGHAVYQLRLNYQGECTGVCIVRGTEIQPPGGSMSLVWGEGQRSQPIRITNGNNAPVTVRLTVTSGSGGLGAIGVTHDDADVPVRMMEVALSAESEQQFMIHYEFDPANGALIIPSVLTVDSGGNPASYPLKVTDCTSRCYYYQDRKIRVTNPPQRPVVAHRVLINRRAEIEIEMVNATNETSALPEISFAMPVETASWSAGGSTISPWDTRSLKLTTSEINCAHESTEVSIDWLDFVVEIEHRVLIPISNGDDGLVFINSERRCD